MKIIHEFWECLHCKEKIEIFDEDREEQWIYCPNCGYEMKFNDYRFETWTEEY